MRECDFCYCLAALIYSPFYRYNFEDSYFVNVVESRNILKAALKYNVKRLVYTSTTAVFGISKNGKTIVK